MSIIAKGSSDNFAPAPEGQYQGVCVDVIDYGLVTKDYGGEKKSRHEIRIVFQIHATDEKGKEIRTDSGARFTVRSKPFGLNLSEKGHLRPFLESWRGKKFTKEEAEAGFDIEKLLGANALIQVVHNVTPDNTYANIQSVMPWNSAWGAKLEPENYTREKDRDRPAPAEASAPKAVGAPGGRPTIQTMPAGVISPGPTTSASTVTEDDVPF